MRRRLTALALMPLATAAIADDRCDGGPSDRWRSAEEAQQVVREAGYGAVTNMYLEDGCYELVTSTPEGAAIEVLLDPVTLEIVIVEDPS